MSCAIYAHRETQEMLRDLDKKITLLLQTTLPNRAMDDEIILPIGTSRCAKCRVPHHRSQLHEGPVCEECCRAQREEERVGKTALQRFLGN